MTIMSREQLRDKVWSVLIRRDDQRLAGRPPLGVKNGRRHGESPIFIQRDHH